MYYTRKFLLFISIFVLIHNLFPLLYPTTDQFVLDYELGRLLACQGNIESARHEFELVLSGKPLEVGTSGRKGKYSMEVCGLRNIHVVD